MSPEERYLTRADPTLVRISEVSLRLMAGQVSRKSMESLQAIVRAAPDGYPWAEVTDTVLAEPLDTQQLVQSGLAAQRDWIVRGGRETPGRGLRMVAKTGLAKLLVRALFFLLYLLMIVALLIVARQKWPAFDIYRVLGWLQEALPGLFPPR